MAKPTPSEVAEDLHYANELGGRISYAYEGEQLLAQTYTDEGDIEARYPVTITIGEALPAAPREA